MFEKQRKLFVDIDGTLAVWQVGRSCMVMAIFWRYGREKASV